MVLFIQLSNQSFCFLYVFCRFFQLLNMFECEKISLMWLRGNSGHIVDDEQFRSLIIRCRSICLCAITPTVTVGDDIFLQKFFENRSTKKVLLLDQCAITSAGLIKAVQVCISFKKLWVKIRMIDLRINSYH